MSGRGSSATVVVALLRRDSVGLAGRCPDPMRADLQAGTGVRCSGFDGSVADGHRYCLGSSASKRGGTRSHMHTQSYRPAVGLQSSQAGRAPLEHEELGIRIMVVPKPRSTRSHHGRRSTTQHRWAGPWVGWQEVQPGQTAPSDQRCEFEQQALRKEEQAGSLETPWTRGR